MALESEAIFLRKAVRAKVLDPDKGTAALFVYSQLLEKGAQFTFIDFLVNQGLMTQMAARALVDGRQQAHAVSTVGDYDLLETIGEGENGVVFRALQRSLDRVVALKIVSADLASDKEALKRFQNEARATARLNHPNIVMGIDVGTDQGLHYFAMEFVDGGTATELIKEYGGKVPEVTALTIVRQAAEGLRAAHAAGLLHKDIKPDNILLTKDGTAKLADLGISQAVTARGKSAEFWASPPYVAPEVLRGIDDDPRSDVYSLGATLFELLAGRPPFLGNTPQETMQMHLVAPIPDLRIMRPDIHPMTADVVAKMIAKRPADRIQDANSVVGVLGMLLTMQSGPAQGASPGRTTRPHARVKAPARPAARSAPQQRGAAGRLRKRRR